MTLSVVIRLLLWAAVTSHAAEAALAGSFVLTFDPPSVPEGGSFRATFSAASVTSEVYVDIRFRTPGGNTDQLALNWQKGISAAHSAPIGGPTGVWMVTGYRPHSGENDHAGEFISVSSILAIDPLHPNTAHPIAQLRPTAQLAFPGQVDSNSPAFRDGDRLYLFNSAGNFIKRSVGPDLESLSAPDTARFNALTSRANHWIEAVWKTADGLLWGWYHAEPWDSICTNLSPLGRALTAPEIGAAVSSDNGLTWYDLGIVLRADPSALRCDTSNGYFSGGVGDLSIMLDDREEYLYIYFGTYSGNVREQGVSVARMKWSDRYSPSGNVWRWRDATWSSPGLGGTSTPMFAAAVDWSSANADAFWGPSIHWNSHLNRYVMLLNRTRDSNFAQEGIYISYGDSLSDFQSWTIPGKIIDGGAWYPQVIGVSDKLAGQSARFFDGGLSDQEIVFSLLEPACTLRVDQRDYDVGETAHLDVTTNLSGYGVFWYGTKDGRTDVEGVYVGRADIRNLDYGPFSDTLIPTAQPRRPILDMSWLKMQPATPFAGRILS
jgi:hypothetical protein